MIKQIIENGTNITVSIGLLDLKEAFLSWAKELKQEEARKEENYITSKEASKMLGVKDGTLWRWDKVGYLRKYRIGKKVYYRESDVKQLINS